jgi:hypothetical protein
MCAELIDALDSGIPAGRIRMSPLANRARALLAQPKPKGPTDEDLEDLAEVMNVSGNPVPAMRRALELWGCQ